MKCAKCPGALQTLHQDDLALDRCDLCRGFFFDPGELTKIFTDHDPQTLKEELCALPVAADANPAVCPRCGHLMTRVSSVRVPTVTYDVCLHCNGIWLDAGELSALDQEHTERRQPQRTYRQQLQDLAHAVRRYFEDELVEIDRRTSERLSRLSRLRQRGLVPAPEFTRIKREIERHAADSRSSALRTGLLQDVDSLRREGFLSEPEYRRMKKKLLSRKRK